MGRCVFAGQRSVFYACGEWFFMPYLEPQNRQSMIKRIVRLQFKPEHVPAFLAIFEESKNKIRHFPGCQHVELLQEAGQEAIFCTFSRWESLDALEEYRQSELFTSTWARTKVLFAERPQAWSFEEVSRAGEM
jgi:quinol monooxygenase YgiN